jgi:hypothetical protein
MAKRAPNKAKRVKRGQSADGGALPTAKEVALAGELAERWRLDLAKDWRNDLSFVRAFLTVFALDRRENPPEQVLRRLRVARQLAWDGATGTEIARKLDVPECLGPVLHAYGLTQVPRSWREAADVDEDPPQLDRLTELSIEGDESGWQRFEFR